MSEKKCCMVVQPMSGLTDEEILETRNKAKIAIEEAGYEFINTYFTEYSKPGSHLNGLNIPVSYLSRAIDIMSGCQAVYFCKGWEKSRGCKIEHAVASSYGYECIYE